VVPNLVAAIAGLLFLVVHAIYLRYSPKPRSLRRGFARKFAARIPERVPRHSLVARLFHWIMAAAMFTLLFTASSEVGVPFDWVTYHWIAGAVLTASIVFHVITASFWLTLVDLAGQSRPGGAAKRLRRFIGLSAPPRAIRQIPAGKQAVPWRDRRDGSVRHLYCCSCCFACVRSSSPQSLSVW